ncbi:putative nuclease HARBI1 [Eurosta solidaginis]|uniref:putative nuclease HARBI1 n=1 Tax=Eurosta solidaginis TaxID=178769 RepID=UPI00353143AB
MCKDAAWFVFSLIKDKIYLGARNNAMQPHQMFFIALRFYASGSFQQIVADLSRVSKASASRAITLVSYHLASLRRDFVKFPQTEQERLETQAAFKEKANFPRVIGAMDCTHVKINSPVTHGHERTHLVEEKILHPNVTRQGDIDISSIMVTEPNLVQRANISKMKNFQQPIDNNTIFDGIAANHKQQQLDNENTLKVNKSL